MNVVVVRKKNNETSVGASVSASPSASVDVSARPSVSVCVDTVLCVGALGADDRMMG